MKLCLDISATPYGTGVSRYTTNLARSLSDVVSPGDTFSLFGSSFRAFNQLKKCAHDLNHPAHLFLLPPRITSHLFNHLNLPIEKFVGNNDIFHSWDWYFPQSSKMTVVTTVHDLALFKFKNIAHPDIKAHHQFVLNRIKKLDSSVIAVSQATKNDLIQLFGIKETKITVIYEALPQESMLIPTEAELQAVKIKYSISKPYFLMVGTREPRKNYLRQIRAWHLHKQDFNLVIVGKPGWETIEPESGLIQIGYADSSELAALYEGAESLLYCSLEEGFGLPLLEAFYHHVPVVTSNVTSLSEIAGTAAIQVDPNDETAIAKGIQLSLDKKQEFISKGNARLSHFSWNKTALETMAFYKKAIDFRA